MIPHEFAAATDLVRQKRHKSSRMAVAAGLNQAAGAMSLFSTHAAAALECHLPNCSSASAAAATICQRVRVTTAREGQGSAVGTCRRQHQPCTYTCNGMGALESAAASESSHTVTITARHQKGGSGTLRSASAVVKSLQLGTGMAAL